MFAHTLRQLSLSPGTKFKHVCVCVCDALVTHTVLVIILNEMKLEHEAHAEVFADNKTSGCAVASALKFFSHFPRRCDSCSSVDDRDVTPRRSVWDSRIRANICH